VARYDGASVAIIERSSKLHIDPEAFEGWEDEFKKRNMKEMNAFELTDYLSKELDIIIHRNDSVQRTETVPRVDSMQRTDTVQCTDTAHLAYSPRACNPPITTTAVQLRNKKADFELQRMFNDFNDADNNLNIKTPE